MKGGFREQLISYRLLTIESITFIFTFALLFLQQFTLKRIFTLFICVSLPSLLIAQNWLNTTAGAIRHVEIGDLDVTGNRITVEALVTRTGPSINIVSKHTSGADLNYLLRAGTFEIATTNGYFGVTNSYALLDNVPYHLAGVYDGATLKYYVNGCLTGSIAASGNLIQNDWETSIANRDDCECEQWVGYIDEVRIWNVGRTQAEIQANMNTLPTPTTQTGLLSYHIFEGSYVNAQGNPSWNGTPIGAVTRTTNPLFTGPIQTVTTQVQASTDITCYNGNDGAVTVTSSGGTTPYTYSIDGVNFQASPTFTGLVAGTYTVTTQSGTGCQATVDVTLTEPPQITFTLNSITDAQCNGSADGAISVAVVNGVPTLDYLWSNGGATTNPATGLAANTYTVTVTDNDGCIGDTMFTVGEPPALTVSVTASTPTLCFGSSDGTANAAALGGTSPYTYAWDSGETGDYAIALNAGNHVVTVTDNHNCTATNNIAITQPTQLTATITAQTEPNCFGGNDASATVTAANATPPYLYSWSDGETNATAITLSANSYSVTVSDNNGCVVTTSVTITQPPQLTATISAFTNVGCNGDNDGSATVTAAGGVPGYTYTWSDAQTTTTATALVAGFYDVTVSDSHACTATASITITEPVAIDAGIFSFTNVSCNGGSDGSATVLAQGGTNTFSYLWNNGQTNATATGLVAGNYSVTVTDGNNCSVIVYDTIYEPAVLTASIVSSTDVNCYGGNDGSVTVQALGGFAPYSYSWSSGENQATANALVSGNNTVSVIDINGCIANASVTLTQPTQLVMASSQPTTICLGSNTTINANAAGGVQPYVFTWNNGFVGSSQTVGPNTNTSYYVHVRDANNCLAGPDTVRVFVRPPLTVVVSPSFEICEGESGTIQATAAGGDNNFSYAWTNGLAGTPGPFTVAPDTTTTYNLTVTDGCGTPAAIGSVTVTVNPLPVALFSSQDTTGCIPLPVQFDNASTISSGTIAQYQWTFGDGQTSGLPNPLIVYPDAGTYDISLIAISAKGCRDTFDLADYIISRPIPIADFSLDPEITPIIAPEIKFTDNSIGASVWQWTFGDGDSSTVSSPIHTYRDTGTYYIYLHVENDYGCFSDAFHRVIINPFSTIYIPNAFTPDDDGINDTWFVKGSNMYEFELKIYNRWGVLMFYTNDPFEGWTGLSPKTSKEAEQDVYVYTIYFRDEGGKQNRRNGYLTLVR